MAYEITAPSSKPVEFSPETNTSSEFNWRGAWTRGLRYVINSVVYHRGSSFRALRETSAVPGLENPLDWEPVALSGLELNVESTFTDILGEAVDAALERFSPGSTVQSEGTKDVRPVITTLSLLNNASADLQFPLAKQMVITKITTSAPARLKLFKSLEDRETNGELVLDVITTAGELEFSLPTPLFCSFEENVVYGILTNTSGFTSDLTASVNGFKFISGTQEATDSAKGVIALTGDLGGTAANPTVPGLNTKTTLIKVSFSYGDASPKFIYKAPADTLIVSAAIFIETAFDGSSVSLSLGDTDNNSRLLNSSQIYCDEVGVYEVRPGYKYINLTDIYLYINLGSGNTSGNGYVILEI